MTRDEAVTQIQEQLGFTTAYSSRIVTNLQVAQQALELAPTKPWFLISEDAYVDTVAGEQRIELPEDFLEETDEATLRYVPTDTTQAEVDLVKDDYDQLRTNFRDSSTGLASSGPPEAYALLDGYFRIFPLPDDVYRLHMIYYAKAELLTSNIENNWLKWNPLLLMGKAGGYMASALRDSAAASIFRSWENEGRILLATQNEARKHANRRYQMGGPH